MAQTKLIWQSKLTLLAVLPVVGASVVLEVRWWALHAPSVSIWTVGLSLLLALVVLKLHAATPGGAFAGATIAAGLMFSTATLPYRPWHTALVPVLAVSLLAHLATRLGRAQKERLGTAEKRRGRSASQVASNLGVAALVSDEFAQSFLSASRSFSHTIPQLLFAVGLAALAEAAADTVSSEVGQVLSLVLGGQPRLITTLRAVTPGTDGAVSLAGTLAGIAAAVLVSLSGILALGGNSAMFWVSCAGGVFGLFFDSLLGATLERRGWLNNDAVNFLSTAGAVGFALVLLAFLAHSGMK